MKKSLLALALKIAQEKLPLHPQLECYPHYTFLIQGNQLVEWATNTSQDPPVHYGYKRKCADPDYRPKVHSEIAAYRKAKGILKKNQGFEVINIRLNRSRQVRLSRPCVCCFEILKDLGCRRFYYSCNIGWLKI